MVIMVRKITAFLLLMIILASRSIGEPVHINMEEKVAKLFLNRQLISRLHKSALTTTVSEMKQISNNEDGRTLAYIAVLEPEGYIILSADSTIKPILGYSLSGRFPFQESPDNTLLHLVKLDTITRLMRLSSTDVKVKSLVKSNQKAWNEYVSEDHDLLSLESKANVWGPLLSTHWHQKNHYNIFCPVYPGPDARSLVGCVAVAAAQIINYWQFPKRMDFTDEDAYSPSWAGKSFYQIPEDSKKYDFPSFDELNIMLATIEYNGDPTEEAYLCFAAGIKFKTAFTVNGSPAHANEKVFRKLGFTSAVSGSWPELYEMVIDNIRNCWPVQMSIASKELGHSVVVDGYDQSLDQFHINMGYVGSGDVWYSLPAIQEFDTIVKVICNITPNFCTSEPADFVLLQNMPNPFNPVTVINYSIPKSTQVNIIIYNILGQKVKTLVNRFEAPGGHSAVWDTTDESGNSVSSGVYIYQLSSPECKKQKRMLLVR